MTTIRELLKKKDSSAVISVSPFDMVQTAIALMCENNIGAVLVTEGDNIVGVVTDRDYARKILLGGRAAGTTSVAEIMTPDVFYVTSDDSAEACMALMIHKQIAYLPVVDGGRISGFVSMGDLARAIIGDHESLIDQLSGYIHGQREASEHPERKPAKERRT